MTIQELLILTNVREASDLHLIPGHSPAVRINGELRQLNTFPELTSKEVEQMTYSLLNPVQKEVLLSNKEIDFSTVVTIESGEQIRFRSNAYYERGVIALAFRLIPGKIKSIEELGLPYLLHDFVKLKSGFVLLTGASGQGKSTTLASLINEINQSRSVHIVTVEDPIEYVFPKAKAIVSQRELEQDTHSWNNALRAMLREDPDVAYIGEMRDRETVSAALTLAETGHLVFSTIHTNSASQSVDRIVDMFPGNQQQQIRMQLSMVLSGVITQRLIPNLMGTRSPAYEIMLASQSIKSIIREGKTHLIDNTIQTSGEMGMKLFEDSLKGLIDGNVISLETALSYAFRPDRLLELTKKR
ncbi:hypothetical protein A3D77_02705 [Candidatus Gottesmanbacteria bacterium RIFCSPHIGHO2_02_FULL_39_11]|uniref:Bacterial type II secretion system protein E domain-containing protein n=1 Tax=Candidatus Gottesmanbacteria bacterium RIFCSPHIGHO2_02_FULL_39_11 TaxID=1798382 RepID=A0A1F5ZT88_9BACT|nr:MAG: hypothetical protein A3D77_02705 [Candidatus Gottesmanbacteria bacterium RIFCSPHIGHO2_02_FULL_39_11]